MTDYDNRLEIVCSIKDNRPHEWYKKSHQCRQLSAGLQPQCWSRGIETLTKLLKVESSTAWNIGTLKRLVNPGWKPNSSGFRQRYSSVTSLL